MAQVANHELSGILSQLVWPSLTSLADPSKAYFSETLDESRQDLKQKQNILSDVITQRISEKSCAYLKQVADIPRLYRRTNRDLPSKPCTYMTTLLEPILTFSEANASRCPPDIMHQWLVSIFAKVSANFFANVTEVLDTVQKMEEALMRLKQVRAVGGGGSEKVTAEKPDKGQVTTVSDDDKIRLQLLVDVKHYIQTMESLGITQPKIEVAVIDDLENLVEKATRACYDDYLQKLAATGQQ